MRAQALCSLFGCRLWGGAVSLSGAADKARCASPIRAPCLCLRRAAAVPRAHVDILPAAARQLARELEASGRLPAGAAAGPVAVVNVWRATGAPVAHMPLAVLDRRTVDVNDVQRYYNVEESGQGVGAIALLRAPPEDPPGAAAPRRHRWVRFSYMTPDEVLLVVQYDGRLSAGTEDYCGGTFHAAAELMPAAVDDQDAGAQSLPPPPPRESCEVRCMVALHTAKVILVVCGVCGAGKSTAGEATSACLGWAFLEGDKFHPAANRAKMAAGEPLADEDRWGWLDEVGAAAAVHAPCVVACSALKPAYRRRLAGAARAAGIARVAFAHLAVRRDVLAMRLEARKHAFMSASLLDSQLATLDVSPGEGPGGGGGLDASVDASSADVADVAEQLAQVARERLLRESCTPS